MTQLGIARRLLAVLVMFTIASSTAIADDAPLKWKFSPNDSLKLKFDQKNSFEIKVMGQNISNISELKLAMTWTVKSIKDGVAEISQTIDTVDAHIQAQGVNIDFDSTQKEDPGDPAGKALASIYRAVIGVPYVLTVTSNGEITAVKIPDQVAEALEKSPFKGMADAGSVFNEKGLKVMFAQILPILPVETLKQGADLKDTKLEIPTGPFTMNLTYKSKVAKLEAEKAQIDSTVDTKLSLPAESPLAIKLTKQSGSRAYTFNPSAGLLNGSDLKQEFEMTLSVNNMDIEQTISLEAVLKVEK